MKRSFGEARIGLLRDPVGRPSHQTARIALWLALLLALPGGAQIAGRGPYPPPQSPSIERSSDGFGDSDPVMAERRLRDLNAARQRSLVADTEKLLKLTRQLNSEIARTNPDMLTQAQLTQIAEIEKLARSVKDKMSYSAEGPQELWIAPASQHR